MKSDKEIEDELLGRWLAGELDGLELEEFEASEYFQTYKAIEKYSDQLEVPSYDQKSEFQKLQTTINEKKEKSNVIKMPLFQKLAIAAGFALLIGFGLTYLYNVNQQYSDITVFTAQGETKSVELPDHSEVALNVASKIEYSKENWNNKREVHLTGEAYFKVSKGSRFVVNTDQGMVEVLGTEFNIRNRLETIEVVCYEGKVKVTDLSGSSKILLPNDAVRMANGEFEEGWTPPISEDADWRNGYSSFHLAPFSTVIEELENQYNVQIDIKVDISNRKYVGAFPHDNLDQALQLVFEPMQLNYKITEDQLIVVE